MTNYLLDTNVVSEWTKPAPDAGVLSFLGAVDEDRVFLSVATLAEIRRGVDLLRDGRKRRRLEGWLTHDLRERFEGRLLPVDEATADVWGRMGARAARSGVHPSEVDALVAATASLHECVLVTRNTKDFEPFGIDLFNPWSESPGQPGVS